MKTLAIIPARGGSKRIPRKNIKNLYGKPIIAYSLDTCKKTGCFDKIHVSTEDAEISKIVAELGFKPDFLRSEKTASDDASIQEVLYETIQSFEEKKEDFDIVCLMSATAPLVESETLKNAFDCFRKSDRIFPLLAVARYPAPIEWALKRSTNSAYLEPVKPENFFQSSHTWEEKYYDTGTFAFFSKQNILYPNSNVCYMKYVVSSIVGVDVDTTDDWTHLESLFRRKNYA